MPPLSQLASFPEWVRISTSPASDLLYPYAFVATDFLIRRHGLETTIDYFRRFSESDDRLGNFRGAFGENWSTFDAAFRAYLTQLVPEPASTRLAREPGFDGPTRRGPKL